MSEWTTIRLGSVVRTNTTSYSPKEGWKYVNYLDTGNITENVIDAIHHIDLENEKLPSRAKRKVQMNSILYSTVRPNQKHFGIIKSMPKNFLVSTGFAVIDVISEKADADYLYFWLTQNTVVEQLHAIAEQSVSAYPSIKASDIENLEIALPPLTVQKSIASILKSISDKMSHNSNINENLEQQAQAIFKEWFIDNPENNEWSTGTFSELIKSTLNGDWGKESPTGNNTEKVYCIRGADIPEVKAGNKGKMPTRYILPKNFATKQLTDGDIVVEISGGSPTQSTGRCTAITQSLLDRYDSGMVCTNFCKAIKPKEGYSLFIYYYWQYLYGKGVFFSYENGTTGIKNLDFSGFIETETILIPPVDKVIAFDDYCKSIFNQIFANGKQNEHLAVLRDTLLPKLMSGTLDVSDIDL
ncbi:restriction endonuclease subunit S [Phascolarctobacterium succinatutens]|uniref:restriction endonuclease subunit S n=1 Tax=Phascolarctobacterium succinatutens TaxID=626940 RepID=UPI0023F72629|nr:restriction endonuclease subunit S [Phascolarctobacterium succinatutens]